jgi:CelD/BcsL family acetyltransferase involved in cellulose biosynthesis
MLTCDLINAQDLAVRDEAVWREMIQATPAFASPLLSPEFTRAVAAARPDTQIAIFRDGGRTVGFLPHHRRPGAFARPAGAPFADYSALITFPPSGPDSGLCGDDALRAAGLKTFQAIGLIDPHGVFGANCKDFNGETEDAYGIDLTFEETTNNVNKKLSKNINRLRRHAAEAMGEVRVITDDRDPTHFARALQLKQAQVRDNGLHDFLAAPWVQKFLGDLFTADRRGLHGYLVTLMAGDTPLLFHFGIRLGDRAHPWVSSFEPAHAAYSPGQIFLQDCQAALKADGIAYYDLSTGQSHYKNAFCNTQFQVSHGRLYGAQAHLAPRVARVAHRARQAMGGAGNALARLNRRIDQIACLELDTMSRLKGVAYAFSHASKRLRAADHG